jgi:glycerol transport system ATP-binding protein
MARIDLENIAHSYDPNAADPVYALRKFSLTWDDGGRYAILGPSGCGKTTMLNIMSGIVTPSEGCIRFDGEDVTQSKTADRNIAQVFQFPVIYNTMSVGDNLSFPLVCRNVDPAVITRKVQEVAETLSLEHLLERPANSLTADQKQLISLGRGLVRDDVAAVLMDEPLTVIDPDLKFRLRRKLKEINEFYKSTLIYVTHDQNEAMTFAHNIIVMDEGSIVQVGTPQELFERPQTSFVGYFIGAPAMNMYEGTISGKNDVTVQGHKFKTKTDLSKIKTDNVKLGIRAEFITLAAKKSAGAIEADVTRMEDFGNYRLVTAQVGEMVVKAKIKREASLPADKVWMTFPAERCCVYADEVLV